MTPRIVRRESLEACFPIPRLAVKLFRNENLSTIRTAKNRLLIRGLEDETGLVTGVPYGSRTRVAAVKGRCPRPLDERDAR